MRTVREFLPRNFRFASWLVKGYDYDYVARTMTYLSSLCSGFISFVASAFFGNMDQSRGVSQLKQDSHFNLSNLW